MSRATPFRIHRLVAVALALGATLAVALPGAPATAFSTTSTGIRLNAVEARLVALINHARTSRGIPALQVTPGTTDVARRWSASQASRNLMSHNVNVLDHLERSGSLQWGNYGENVGYAYNNGTDSLFNAYMASPGHRANILSRSFRYLGIGWAERPDGKGFNTQVFVDAYSAAYGATREPAYGGQADRRTITKSTYLADFESGREPRGIVLATAPGLLVSSLAVQPATAGDQYGRFVVREASASSTGGAGELRLRDAVDLSRARAVAIRFAATTHTAKPIVVDVWLRRAFGPAIALGSVSVPHGGRQVATTFTLPASAKAFWNEVSVSVRRTSLRALNPLSLSGRQAEIRVYGLVAVV